MARKRSAPTAAIPDTSPAPGDSRGDSWSGVLPAMATGEAAGGYGGARYVGRAGLTSYELARLWRQDWLAREAIERKATDATRKWAKLSAPDLDADTIDDVWKHADRLAGAAGVAELFRQAIVWANTFGGCLIVMGLEDGGGAEEPLDLDRLTAIRWQHLADSRYATIAEYDADETADTYGQPKIYQVSNPKVPGGTRRIHASRVLRFDGPLTEVDQVIANGGWNDSAIESVFNALRNYNIGIHGAAKSLEKFSIDLFKQKGLAQTVAAKDGMERLRNRMRALSVGMTIGNVAAVDADGEDYQVTGRPVSGMAELVDRMTTHVSGALAVPQSVLFGQAQGTTRTGAEADQEVYAADIAGEQGRNVIPQALRLVTLIMASRDGPTAGKVPDAFWLEAPPIAEPTASSAAATYKTRMEGHQIAVNMGAIDASEVRSEFEAGEHGVTLDDAITAALATAATAPSELVP